MGGLSKVLLDRQGGVHRGHSFCTDLSKQLILTLCTSNYIIWGPREPHIGPNSLSSLTSPEPRRMIQRSLRCNLLTLDIDLLLVGVEALQHFRRIEQVLLLVGGYWRGAGNLEVVVCEFDFSVHFSKNFLEEEGDGEQAYDGQNDGQALQVLAQLVSVNSGRILLLIRLD